MGTDANDAVLARIEQLEAEVRSLRVRQERPEPPAATHGDSPVTRRRLMGMAGAAAAGAVGATVLAASPAEAATGDPITVDNAFTGTGTTSLSSSVAGGLATFLATNNETGVGFGAGIQGISFGDGVGVEGNSETGIGVTGVANGTNGDGLAGFTDSGNALRLSPPSGQAGSHMRLEPHGTVVGGPTASAHLVGQFWMDTTGVLFQCVVGGTPGTWVRQAPLVTLPAPVRVYDSRAGQPNQAPNTQGALSFTSAPPSAAFRDVACNKNASSGATAVPAGATTLLMNLTVISLSGVGALAAYATGAAQPSTSSINWSSGGLVLANSVTSACNASQHVNVAIVAGAGASTNFILDVIGYYL
jgi:hypothetical protein